MATDDDGPAAADPAEADRAAGDPAAADPVAGDPVPADPPVSAGSGRRWRRVIAFVVILAVVAGLGLWTDHKANEYYVYEPGTAPRLTTEASCRANGSDDVLLPDGTPCARLVVPAARSHTIDGQLLMVDVLVGQATPVEYALHELGLLQHFHRGAQLLPNEAVRGSTPASQLACQGAEEMTSAQTVAPVAALRRLGYRVAGDDRGAQVEEVVPGTAATAAGLMCNDLVTGLDGHTVRTADDLARIVGAKSPGARLEITVLRTGTDGKAATLTLHATLRGRPAIDGAPAAPKVGFLGVMTATDTTYKLPFDVRVDVGDIGGPSAGLALTLGLLDTLSGGRLTGGHTIAATGTIAANGDVGDVGGVAQKTVAVERAGAQLFLVPPQEYAAAESEANGHMRIVKVTTLDQALAAIEAIGGHIPAASS